MSDEFRWLLNAFTNLNQGTDRQDLKKQIQQKDK